MRTFNSTGPHGSAVESRAVISLAQLPAGLRGDHSHLSLPLGSTPALPLRRHHWRCLLPAQHYFRILPLRPPISGSPLLFPLWIISPGAWQPLPPPQPVGACLGTASLVKGRCHCSQTGSILCPEPGALRRGSSCPLGRLFCPPSWACSDPAWVVLSPRPPSFVQNTGGMSPSALLELPFPSLGHLTLCFSPQSVSQAPAGISWSVGEGTQPQQ